VKRIAVVGGPRTGKTTLAGKLARDTGLPLIASDDFKDLGWSEASQHVADLLAKNEPAIVEGVAVPRAIRKALAANPEQAPIDKLIVVEPTRRWHEKHSPQSDGQRAMGKGVHTVLEEILPELRALGVAIEWRSDPGEEL
jgi:dephospho-CoA kinase